jgi:hypothetical protein
MNPPDIDAIDISRSLPVDIPGGTPEANVWQLLCACTLSEVEPSLLGIRADDIAAQLSLDNRYRALEPEAAAYLWLSANAEPTGQEPP